MRMGIAQAFKRCLIVAIALALVSTAFYSPLIVLDASSSSASTATAKSISGLYTKNVSAYQWFTNSSIAHGNIKKIAVGDLNHDGKLDIAAIYYGVAKVEIFYQRSEGNYSSASATNFTTSSVPTDIAVGDMNEDGYDDIVVCMNVGTTGRIAIYSQASGFTLYYTAGITDRFLSMGIADFNHDGKLDVAVASSTYIYIWTKSDSPFDLAFDQLDTSGTYNILLPVDYNGDGWPDIVLAASQDISAHSVVVLTNTQYMTDWTNSAPFSSIPRPSSLDIMAPSSGNPYIMIASNGNGMVYLYQWNGASFDGGSKTNSISGLRYAKAMDLNGDALPDIVTVSNTTNTVSYFYTTEMGQLYQSANGTFPCQGKPVQLITGLVNKDADQDLIICQNSSTASSLTVVYNSNGEIGNANENIWTASLSCSPDTVFVGNFTGRHQAVGFLNISTSAINILEDGSWSTISGTGLRYAITANLSGAGKQSLIYLDSSPSFHIVPYGSSFYASSPISVATSLTDLRSIVPVDWDRDGNLDLVVSNATGFQVFSNSGSGSSFTASPVYSMTNTNFGLMTVGDFNVAYEGSGVKLNDVAAVWANGMGVTIFIQSSGEPKFSWASDSYCELTLPAKAGRILWIGSYDLSGDGRTDIVVGTSNGTVVLYRQASSTTGFDDSIGYKTIINLAEGFSNAALGDYDDDGSIELAVVGSKASIISLLEFSGATYSLMYHQTAGSGKTSLAIGDANGDGLPDVVASSNSSHSISVYFEMNRPPTASFTLGVAIPTEGTPFSVDASASTDTASDRGRLNYSYYAQYNQTGPWILLRQTNNATTSLIFASNGTHLLKLVVRDPGGLTASMTMTVRAYDSGPTAAFVPPSGVEGTPIQFTDSSTYVADAITAWTWNFGDGTAASHSQNPTHTYAWNATFHVTLTVSDRDGNTSSITHNVVIIDALPTASFTCSSTTIAEGDTILFDASGSSSKADTIVNYAWTFENGTYSSSGAAATISHQFLKRGIFWVNLTVTENDTGKGWCNKTITVLDHVPTVTFTMSNSTIDEGDTVSFQAQVVDSQYDPVTAYLWNFGDDQTSSLASPSHRYVVHGIFTVSLTVWDQDGSSASYSLPIRVNDTNPTVGEITVSPSAAIYYLGSNLTFQVPVTQGYETPTYEWTISTYDGLVVQAKTSVPSFHYQFLLKGSYHVLLKVNDSDFQTERTFDLTISDAVPAVSLKCTGMDLDNLTVFLSAEDTNDPDYIGTPLQYSWNFGDGNGWTPWNTSGVTSHPYTDPGSYTVSVKVRDLNNENSTSITVVLDKWHPIIELKEQISKAYIGDSILIVAHITDNLSFSAKLLYSLDGENYTEVVMTPMDTGGNYSALIPAQTHTGTVWYKVNATDANDNSWETSPIAVSIELHPDQTMWLIASVVMLMVIVILLIYLWITRPVVDEVFIIYRDGNLIAHQTRRLKPGMDDQILGSMLVALQNFVHDSFKDENKTGLKRMDFGEKKLMVEKGEYIYIAVVLNGSRTGKVPGKLEKVIRSIDNKFGTELPAWDGDLEKLRGMRDETQPLFERGVPFSKGKGKKGRANGGQKS